MRRFANAIIVGGPIAVGKSTLVSSLPFQSIAELLENDRLQKLLLERMYRGDNVAAQVFQLDMLHMRFERYLANANRAQLTVFDRSLFEDRLFAERLLRNNPSARDYYLALWHDKAHALVDEVGVPQLYIFLDCSWQTFRQRLFSRARHAEVDNFDRNEAYFRMIITNYGTFMRRMFAEFELPHAIIMTDDLNEQDVLIAAQRIIRQWGLANE